MGREQKTSGSIIIVKLQYPRDCPWLRRRADPQDGRVGTSGVARLVCQAVPVVFSLCHGDEM